MPLDGDGDWNPEQVLTAREILAAISAVYPLERVSAPGSSDPATLYRFADGDGEIGIIPTVTEPFCASCNRIRLTADGKLRHCLFAVEETDLKAPLRAGASDEGSRVAVRGLRPGEMGRAPGEPGQLPEAGTEHSQIGG